MPPDPRTDICSGLIGNPLTSYWGSSPAEAPPAASASVASALIEIRRPMDMAFSTVGSACPYRRTPLSLVVLANEYHVGLQNSFRFGSMCCVLTYRASGFVTLLYSAAVRSAAAISFVDQDGVHPAKAAPHESRSLQARKAAPKAAVLGCIRASHRQWWFLATRGSCSPTPDPGAAIVNARTVTHLLRQCRANFGVPLGKVDFNNTTRAARRDQQKT